jgi:hypothetical protein
MGTTNAWFFFFAALALPVAAACSASDSGDIAASSEIAFHGEQSAFPDVKVDTGMQPSGSPVQVQLTVGAQAKITADAIGVSEGLDLVGKPGSGKVAINGRFTLEARLKVDLTGAPKYDGPIPGVENLRVEFGKDTPFDPFLIGGAAHVAAELPETKLPPIPLPGGIPGTLVLTIAKGSVVMTDFRGVCAGVDQGRAQYLGKTTSSGSLVVKPTVEIKLPIGAKSFDLPAQTIALPKKDMPMDLGSQPVAGGGDGPSKKGSCTAAAAADGGAGVADGGSAVDGGGGGTSDGGTAPRCMKNADCPGQICASVSGTCVPDPDLVVHLPLDETSGRTAADVTGNGHPGTVSAGPTWGSGKIGGALHCNGAGTVDVGNLGGLSSWTIAYWVATDSASKSAIMLDANAATLPGSGPRLQQVDDGTLQLAVGASNAQPLSFGAVPSQTWHHVVAVFDAPGTTRVHLDGYLRSQSLLAPAVTAFNSFRLCAGPGAMLGFSAYAGWIDDVRVYRRALQADEISALYTVK